MDLRTDNPAAVAAFVAACEAAEVSLPVEPCPAEPAVVLDVRGRQVCVVDPNNDRTDAEAAEIAEMIVCAINACGGFPTVLVSKGEPA